MVGMWGRRRSKRRKRGWDWCDCDLDFCDLPCCDFGLLSTTLLMAGGVAVPKSDRVVIGAIRAYRRVSPRLPTSCRFTPTCSAYGLEAVQRHGARKGLRMTAGRLRRCRPGVPHGTADPVG